MPAKHVPVAPSPREIRSAIAGALRAGLDPKLETPFGWMLLRRQITERQHEAGERFARLACAYGRAIGAKRRSARSADLERVGGWGNGRIEDAAQDAETRARYELARQRLKSVGAYEAIVSLCVDGQAPASLEVVRKGLAELAEFFRV